MTDSVDPIPGQNEPSDLPGTTASGNAEGSAPRRDIKLLRDTLSMLCHYIWHRGLRPGDHLWSIPVDRDRDFDCILSDAIDELEVLRSREVAPAARVTRLEVIDHRISRSAPGRVFTARPAKVELSYQDDGRTLKVFVTDAPPASGGPSDERR